MQLDPKLLTPHKLHAQVYGDGADDALVESVKERGVISPLVATRTDGQYRLIAGHRRREAAIAAGLKGVDVQLHEYDSEAAEHIAVIESNRQRVKRPIQIAREGKALDVLYAIEAKQKQQEQARAGKEGGRGKKKPLPPSGGKGSAQRHGRETTERVAKAVGLTSGKAWTQLEKAYDEMPEVVEAAADMTALKRAVHQEKKRKAQEKEREAFLAIANSDDSAIDIHVSTMAKLLSRFDSTLDAIITDPPYDRDALPLYKELAIKASSALCKSGVLAVMCGQSYLPEILATMSQHIPYRWMLAYLTPGGQAVQLWQRKVNTFWKPILLFGAKPERWLGDVVKSKANDNDKRFHGLGQSESGMRDLIEKLTEPGQLVCDPFMGAGTTGVACLSLGRRFVGGDIDPACVQIARGRLIGASRS